jgi:phosphoribosylglycinamide formyltransferase-1
MVKPLRLVVLISGNGSNLQAVIDQIAEGDLNAEITAVISNQVKAYGLIRAGKAGIPQHILPHKAYAERTLFDQALSQCIDQYRPDLVVLAGFMRILSLAFVNRYLGRLVNIHPSLLPRYPGLNTHQQVLAAGDEQHGASVHFVTPQLDQGPVILQASFPVLADDNLASLIAKVQQQEHWIYPQVIRWFSQQRLKLVADQAFFDNQPLPVSGYPFHLINPQR